MKKLSIFAMLLLLAPASREAASPSYNGTDWQLLSSYEQGVYVLGVLDGTFLESYSIDPGSVSAMHQYFEDDRATLVRKDGLIPSAREISSAVSTFYQVPENLPVCWVHATKIEWLSLVGNAPAQTVIAEWRSRDGHNGCK
jgi:hypothetical protein